MGVITDEETEKNADPVATASDAAWLDYAKGTFSLTDKRIFEQGFRDGWRMRRERMFQQMPQSYTSITVSCWLCRGEHLAGVKWCPVLVKVGL